LISPGSGLLWASYPPLPAANVLPSGLKHTQLTQPVGTLRVERSVPVAASQVFTVPSWLPEASVRPSGLNATPRTSLLCPRRVTRWVPVATSHNFTVVSSLAEARVLPSGLKVTAETRRVCATRQSSCHRRQARS